MDILRFLTAVFFPERCPFCGALIEPCETACKNCHREIIRRRMPIKGGARGFRCVSSFSYKGQVRRMILRIKYRERTQFLDQIAEVLVEDIRLTYGEEAFDLVTAVPMYRSEQSKRGYNQAKLLGKAIAKQLDLPYRDTLKKIKHTKKQHSLKYADRRTNLNGAFALIDKEAVKDRHILIVDDIVTSGFTLGNCCRVLNRGKPASICCATIASAKNKYLERSVL